MTSSKPFFQPIMAYGLRPVLSTATQTYEHSFCGAATDPSAHCPNCDRPLKQFLKLDAHDPRLEVSDWTGHFLPLYYCWSCNVAQEHFAYRVIAAKGSISILRFGQGGATIEFPYPEYPTSFPLVRVDLEEIPQERQSAICDINAGSYADYDFAVSRFPELLQPRHQIGGEPILTQGWLDVNCADCGSRMPLLASISNDCEDPRGLHGYDFAQVLYFFCRACSVISAVNVCD
jgi:hypothetical protein